MIKVVLSTSIITKEHGRLILKSEPSFFFFLLHAMLANNNIMLSPWELEAHPERPPEICPGPSITPAASQCSNLGFIAIALWRKVSPEGLTSPVAVEVSFSKETG